MWETDSVLPEAKEGYTRLKIQQEGIHLDGEENFLSSRAAGKRV